MGKASFNMKSFINFLSYVAIVFIGIALLIRAILGTTEIGNALELIAQIFAYAMIAVSSFFYVRGKRNLVFLIIWIVAVVLIIIYVVLKHV